MDECPHNPFGGPQSACSMCLAVPSPPVAKKERKVKRKVHAKPMDDDETRMWEFIAGIRCEICNGLRGGPGNHCWHERAQNVERGIAEVLAWQEANLTGKGEKLVTSAVSAAISRITLRGGLKGAPSPIDGMSIGGLVGLANRVSDGRIMEWKPNSFPSGDPIPV